MKAFIILLAVTICNGSLLSQNGQFRIDCNAVAILQSLDSEWSQWYDAQNTFVINANENFDIIHYRNNGEIVTYRNLGDLETSYTSSGDQYQIISVLDENGYPMEFQLFEDPAIGVKLIQGQAAIQFSNF
jgi:hypothetical protein